MIRNVAHILGIELLAAAQGVEFLRPLLSSAPLEQVHALLRRRCPGMPHDHYLAPDIQNAAELVADGSLAGVLRTIPNLPALWIPA
jgi:histidine ammonia-lyase